MTNKDEALKLALEALKQIDEAMPFPVAKLAQKVIREALAEQPAQQQEPVAWRYKPKGDGGWGWSFIDLKPVDVVNYTIEPLYTSPPASKPWVGLTDEEIKKMHNDLCNTVGSDFKTVARATETKLREKNA